MLTMKLKWRCVQRWHSQLLLITRHLTVKKSHSLSNIIKIIVSDGWVHDVNSPQLDACCHDDLKVSMYVEECKSEVKTCVD